MPLHTTTEFLKQCIRPHTTLREDTECYITVGTDSLCLQTRSKTKNEYLVHTIPVTNTDALRHNIDEPETFWCDIGQIKDFLGVPDTDPLSMAVPCEMKHGNVRLQTPKFRYRFAPLNPDYIEPLPDVNLPEVNSSFTIPHDVFQRAVKVADLVGEQLHISVQPDTQVVEFSADASDVCSDGFTYPLSSDTIAALDGTPSDLTASLGVLPDFVETIPPTTLAKIMLAGDRMIYRTAYPTDDASVRLDTAARRD